MSTKDIRFISAGAFRCNCTIQKQPRCNDRCEQAEGSPVCYFENPRTKELTCLSEEQLYQIRENKMKSGEPHEEFDKAFDAIGKVAA